MPHQPIPAGNSTKQTQEALQSPGSNSRFDPAMGQICLELFTRATLFAGAIGLIAGLAAALLAGE
jgi:hypothetical protein